MIEKVFVQGDKIVTTYVARVEEVFTCTTQYKGVGIIGEEFSTYELAMDHGMMAVAKYKNVDGFSIEKSYRQCGPDVPSAAGRDGAR